jgi:hypothetical protein
LSCNENTDTYRAREWLLHNTKWAIFQLFHVEKKVTFQCDNYNVRYVLDRHAYR